MRSSAKPSSPFPALTPGGTAVNPVMASSRLRPGWAGSFRPYETQPILECLPFSFHFPVPAPSISPLAGVLFSSLLPRHSLEIPNLPISRFGFIREGHDYLGCAAATDYRAVNCKPAIRSRSFLACRHSRQTPAASQDNVAETEPTPSIANTKRVRRHSR